MTTLAISFDETLFDEILLADDCLAEGGDLQLVVKENATHSGNAAVMLTHTVEVDGKILRAQSVTTWPLLHATLMGLKARLGEPK